MPRRGWGAGESGGGIHDTRPRLDSTSRRSVAGLPLSGVATCDLCVVMTTLCLLSIALVWGRGGVSGGGHHHVVHGSVRHNASHADAGDKSARFDNALDGEVFILVHVHYLSLGIAVTAATAVQHAAMLARKRSTLAFLRWGIGAETTLHTLVVNALCVFLCAEVAGLTDMYQLVVSAALHVLSFVLSTAVLLHRRGASVGRIGFEPSRAPADAEAGGVPPGAPTGNGGRESKETLLRWFGLCPIRKGSSFPPVYTALLATSVRVVAATQCILPWMWVIAHYIIGIFSADQPDVTIKLVPIFLLFFNLVKLSWLPGLSGSRLPTNARRVYYVESAFDVLVSCVVLIPALVDVLLPAAAVLHTHGDGDSR